MPSVASRVGKEHTVSEDERVETKWEEFEAHKLEGPRSEDGQVDLGRVEDERVEGKVEDDDFEAHQISVPKWEEKVEDA
jgi:hypothetical protein